MCASGGGTRGDAVDECEELRKLAEDLPPVGELEERATRVSLREHGVDEATVFGARTGEIAPVRERRGEAAMRSEIRRRAATLTPSIALTPTKLGRAPRS